MDVAFIRARCLALPFVTEHVQWGDNLVFKIGVEALGEGAKMFAIAPLESAPGEGGITLKADPERFAELVERPGVRPAPYLARAKWVSVEEDALTLGELAGWIERSYQLVLAGMPQSKRARLSGAPGKAAGSKKVGKKAGAMLSVKKVGRRKK